jgi:hypothetical protein
MSKSDQLVPIYRLSLIPTMNEEQVTQISTGDNILVIGKVYEVGSSTTYRNKGVMELTEVQA